MVRLVNDLLDVSRITRDKIKLQIESVEMSAVVAEAVETSRPLVDESGHQLAISLPPEPLLLEADGLRLGQVVANLLNNAAKYTSTAGQIWLSVRREGSEAVLSVRDNGLGMTAEMLHRVFEPFSQMNHTLPRSQGGLGIGLTLAKRLVELHGGRIEAHSEGPGKGSEFIVYLPLAASKLPRTLPNKPLPREAANPVDALSKPVYRILVVDDQRDSAFVLGKLLGSMGHDVRTASSAMEGLEVAKAHEPQIVISDIGMPDVDGFEFARRLRPLPGMQGAALVALTGFGQENDRQRTMEAGFDYHLVKPASLEALDRLLESISARHTPVTTQSST